MVGRDDLHHINVVAESLQRHLEHDFFREVARALEDHVGFHRADLVVMGKRAIHHWSDHKFREGIGNLCPQSVGNTPNSKKKKQLETIRNTDRKCVL